MLESLLNSVGNFILSAGVKIVVSALILFIGFRLIRVFIGRMKKRKGFKNTDESVRSFAISFLSIALKVLLIITAAAYLGVPMASMVAVVGSAGVAVGLALQGGLSNIAGGIMILIFRPFSIGDYIKSGELEGSVISIGIFSTTLKTVDNKHIVMPNSVLTGSCLVNYSIEKTRRVDLEFTASYSADASLVKNVLLAVAAENGKVLATPAPEAVMVSHEDSAVKYKLMVWCEAGDYWNVNFALNEGVKAAFDKAGIEIPFPQVDVHIEK